VVAVRPGQTHSGWSEPWADRQGSRIQTSLDVPQRTKTCHKRAAISRLGLDAESVARFDAPTSTDTRRCGTNWVLTWDFTTSGTCDSFVPTSSSRSPAATTTFGYPALTAAATAGSTPRTGWSRPSSRTRPGAPPGPGPRAAGPLTRALGSGQDRHGDRQVKTRAIALLDD
jgi:hypothetical protein